jgi:hypothetical protein
VIEDDDWEADLFARTAISRIRSGEEEYTKEIIALLRGVYHMNPIKTDAQAISEDFLKHVSGPLRVKNHTLAEDRP